MWARKVVQHPELVAHEAEVRATVRDPDRVYIDWESAVVRAVRGGDAHLAIMHYVSEHRAHGKQAGNLLSVVVKWLGDPARPGDPAAIRGYVQTAYLPNRTQARLQLHWRRPQ